MTREDYKLRLDELQKKLTTNRKRTRNYRLALERIADDADLAPTMINIAREALKG